MLLPAGGSFVLFNISGAVCESWPRSDRPEASTLVLEKCKIDNPSVSNAAWTTCWDVEGWTLGAGNFTFLSVMTHRLLLLSSRFHTEKWWMGWSSPPPLAPAVILVRGTVKPASLCVSCCIPVEQVSRNFLQNILFFFLKRFVLLGLIFSLSVVCGCTFSLLKAAAVFCGIGTPPTSFCFKQ